MSLKLEKEKKCKMAKMLHSQSKQYSSLNASSRGLSMNASTGKGDRLTKLSMSSKPSQLPKGDKKSKRPASAKAIKSWSEQQLNVLTQKYSVGKTIGRGIDSVVKVCKIRKDWSSRKSDASVGSIGSIASVGSIGSMTSLSASDGNVATSLMKGSKASKLNKMSLIASTSKDASDNKKTSNPGVTGKIANICSNNVVTGTSSAGAESDGSMVSNDVASRLRAMKIIDKSKLPKSQMNDIYNEVNTLKELALNCRNENIVRCYECYETNSRVYIITELLSGLTLENLIIKTYNYSCPKGKCGSLTELEVAQIFYQVLKALETLHSMNIVHRDVKPENFVFTGANGSDAKLKLIDFGLATSVSKHNDKELNRICGTPLYVAPEMISKQQYDTKVDMWAAGIIFYFLLCGYLPFKLRSNDKLSVLYKQILKGNIPMLSPQWYNVSVYAKDLIRKLLTRDPSRRYSATQALQHPWFKVTFAAKNGAKQQSNK